MYPYFRKIAFLRDAESVHESALRGLSVLQATAGGRALLRRLGGRISASPRHVFGLEFRHPLGLAAGFDKDARVIIALQELGFAYVEIGTVTPRPQGGNPKPRIWRFPEAEALVNALGFPGEGMEAVGRRLRQVRDSGRLRIPVGVNIGKNFDTPTEAAAADYLTVFRQLHALGDYFVVNVSSPNTAGLRNLQAVETLRPLLAPLVDYNTGAGRKPLLVKIAPDLANDDIAALARLAQELSLAGLVAGNTTVQRRMVPGAAGLERGGLSGAPQYPRTLEMLRLLRPLLSPEQVIIAAGGISTAARLQECLNAGAALAQVYTPFIYLGPRCAATLLRP